MRIAFHVCLPLVDDRRELVEALAEREGVRRAQRGILLAAPRQPTQRADGDEAADPDAPRCDDHASTFRTDARAASTSSAEKLWPSLPAHSRSSATL